MIMEDKTRETPRWVRKLLIPALIGGVVGFGAAAGMMRLIDSPAVGGLDGSAVVASLIAMFYLIMGVSVGFGAASPNLGARFLNVEDADELREQKKVLTLSGVAMALWGISLFALALAAPDGPVPQGTALMIGVSGLLIGTVISVMVYRACDELMRAINLEAGALTYGLVLLVAGVWAMLAHLGYTAAPSPLDLLSLFYALVLVASFIVIGRRGMLMPR